MERNLFADTCLGVEDGQLLTGICLDIVREQRGTEDISSDEVSYA